MSNAATRTKRAGKFRTHSKGRVPDPGARQQIRALLGASPPRRDMLIEYLHRIQDRHGHLSAAHIVALAAELKLAPVEVYEVATFYHHFDVVKEGQAPPPALTVRVCESVSCELAGARELIDALERALGSGVRVQPVPCVGRCDTAPVAVVGWNALGHADVDAVLAAVTSRSLAPAPGPGHVEFAGYRRQGGYRTLQRVVSGELGGDEIIERLQSSGLRGLGGAGFPAGSKWRIVAGFEGPRLLAVNLDEGEPGTFKDRHYLETDPHRFFEGLLIAAQVVGIDSVYIYTRDEYPHVRAILARELASLRADPPSALPEIHLRRGAGAYICGEESAMIESIEGKRGMPRLRPPYVAEVGLFGRPTLEHNGETLYWVRDILERGPEWFSGAGRHGRKGLRTFSVSGRVNKPGVHLAPAGITLRELVEEYCDGMLPGHELYAYFPGGASGGILPARLADLALDFDTLQEYGCFIGSAAVIVLSGQDSVKQAALNAMRFFAHESCGQCTPCRVGTEKAVLLMEREQWDQPLLRELSQTMIDASICGLGQAAPNPLLTAMKYFPEEFA